jgi:hypothetical protein
MHGYCEAVLKKDPELIANTVQRLEKARDTDFEMLEWYNKGRKFMKFDSEQLAANYQIEENGGK